jgi:hypothetical protein
VETESTVEPAAVETESTVEPAAAVETESTVEPAEEGSWRDAWMFVGE